MMNRAGELGNGGWSWGSGDGGRGKPEGAPVTRRVENGASHCQRRPGPRHARVVDTLSAEENESE